MSALENLKKDIDLINNFSADFFNKTNSISTKISTTLQKIDNMIIEEKQNDVYLTNLEKKVATDELQTVLRALQNYKETLTQKYSEYNQLIDNNSQKIANVSNTIRNNKELIDNVYNLVTNLQETASSIDTKIQPKK